MKTMDKNQVAQESYTCRLCGRSFKEASHFTKHKRGALCKKIAQKAAKLRKKKLKLLMLEKPPSRPAVPHKPYQCNVCAAKFCDKVNVELHLEREHNTHKQLWVEVSKTGKVLYKFFKLN